MTDYLLIDRTALSVKRVTLEKAASMTGLDTNHIEWAIEEFGRCDTGTTHSWRGNTHWIVIKAEYLP
jgi:hypothetical protein